MAELSLLGITYLSRLTKARMGQPRVGWALLADLVRQPSSRVRCATIALFLEHPEYSAQMPMAIKKIRMKNRVTLKMFYTAAVYLQRIHFEELMYFQGGRFCWLPDLYSAEFSIQQELDASQSLKTLGKRQQEILGNHVNWEGTYENVVAHWLNRRKLEIAWNQSIEQPLMIS